MICIAYRAKNKHRDNHDVYKDIAESTLRYNHRKIEDFIHWLVCPKYKLIKDIVYHILSGCDVHDGLRYIDKVFYQLLVLLGDVAHQETNLHGMEIVPDLDLCHGQRHRCATTDAMKGDLLDVDRNIMEEGADEGALGVDGHFGHVRC